MPTTQDLGEVLFKTISGFSEATFLDFLSKRVPTDIVEQLNSDGQPDLGLSKSVTAEDLVRPLSSHVFPSNKLWEMADILSYITICYAIDLEKNSAKHSSYKVVYVTSLYLYCYVRAKGPGGGAYLTALGILADYSLQLDLDSRLQVLEFLRYLVPMIYAEAVGSVTSALSFEDAPLSSVLISLSVVAGSIISGLGVIVTDTMKSERIGQAWSAEEVPEGTPSYRGVRVLKRLVSEMFGVSGRVRQATGPLLGALEEEKE